MIAVEHAVTIDRPVQEVFAFTVDPDNVPLWQPAVVSMRAEGPAGVGQRVIQTRRLLGRSFDLVVEIFAFEPNRRFGMRMVSGPVRGSLLSTFHDLDASTRVTLTAQVPGGRLLRAANALAAEAAKRELVANCRRLKALIEQGDSAS